MPAVDDALRTPVVVPAVHAVTTDEIVLAPDFRARAAALLVAGGERVALHLRGSRVPSDVLFTHAEALGRLAAAAGGRIVVNDRVDVALAAGAWGVQLNSRSLLPADARRAIGAHPLRLGASVHSIDEGRAAEAAGADWVVAGHVFETASHPGEEGRGVAFVRGLVAAVRLPVVVIGGIRPEHVAELRPLGVAGVAVIRGVWSAEHPDRALTRYLSGYDDGGRHHPPDDRADGQR